jgi:hypothetical protein
MPSRLLPIAGHDFAAAQRASRKQIRMAPPLRGALFFEKNEQKHGNCSSPKPAGFATK